jgi:hypothetical protein
MKRAISAYLRARVQMSGATQNDGLGALITVALRRDHCMKGRIRNCKLTAARVN